MSRWVSVTRKEVWLEEAIASSLLPGGEAFHYVTSLRNTETDEVIKGYGNTPDESQLVAKQKLDDHERKSVQAANAEAIREERRRTEIPATQGRPRSKVRRGRGRYRISYRIGEKLGELTIVLVTLVFALPGYVLDKIFPGKPGTSRQWLYAFLFWTFLAGTIWLQCQIGAPVWFFGIQLVLLSLVNLALGLIACESLLKSRLPLVAQRFMIKLKEMQCCIGWSGFVIGLFYLIWSVTAQGPLLSLVPELTAIAVGIIMVRPSLGCIEAVRYAIGLACILISVCYPALGWKIDPVASGSSSAWKGAASGAAKTRVEPPAAPPIVANFTSIKRENTSNLPRSAPRIAPNAPSLKHEKGAGIPRAAPPIAANAASFKNEDTAKIPSATPPIAANVPNVSGVPANTKIHDAAKTGDLAMVKALLKDFPDLVFSQDKEFGAMPLFVAAGSGHKAVAELLLANKADVNAREKYGLTALHEAVSNGHRDMAELLLAKGADANAKDKKAQTPLHWVARNHNGSKDMAELLLTHGAEVNAKDKFGYTPFHWAAAMGNTDVVNLLQRNGGHE